MYGGSRALVKGLFISRSSILRLCTFGTTTYIKRTSSQIPLPFIGASSADMDGQSVSRPALFISAIICGPASKFSISVCRSVKSKRTVIR